MIIILSLEVQVYRRCFVMITLIKSHKSEVKIRLLAVSQNMRKTCQLSPIYIL